MAKIVNTAYPISKVGSVVIDTSKKCHSSNYTKVGSRTVRYVVMHYTGNSKDYAWNNANYFTGANRNASAHFFVDDDEIYQSIGLNDKAWHCGDDEYFNDCRNSDSIGIEMCCTAGNYDMSAKTVELAAQLCADLCKFLDITDVDKYVVRHWDVTHKECPRPMVRNTARWEAFKKRVAELLNVKTTPSTETNSNSVLEYGDEGSAVKSLQQRLIALGYSCGSAGADGDFGSGTEAAVIKFQKAMKIDADGVVGVQTYAALTKAEAAKKTAPTTKTTTTTKTSTTVYDATPDDIKEVQTWMNKNYSSGLAVDGGYGPLTKAAIVKAVQKQIGTTVDGGFGPNSKAKWTKLLQNGSSGKLVQLVQCMLICQGYSVGSDGADGAFGNDTKAAVARFQKNKKIQADGVVGKETAYYLFH